MKLRVVVFIMFVVMFLDGCISTRVATSIPSITVKPSVTSSVTPAGRLNYTLTPSPTLSSLQITATSARAIFNKSIETQIYIKATEIPSTLEARKVKCKDGFYLEQPLDILQYSNDKWTLFTCSPIPKNENDKWTPGVVDYGTRYTELVKTDLSKTWTIQHKSFDYTIIDRPDALMVPFWWTADGRYLYLYPRNYPGGSGFPRSAFLYSHISNLYRINLETGVFEPFLTSDHFGAIAFSPDSRFLVYSDRAQTDVIHIKNMETGDSSQVKLYEDIVASGAFLWSTDSTKVVFTAGYGNQSNDWQDDLSGTAIFILYPKDVHIRKVLAKDSRIFMPHACSDHVYWLDKNTICLYSSNNELDSWNKIYTFNLATGVVEYLRDFP
jgi:hypothetical protein